MEDVEWSTLTSVDWFNNLGLHTDIGMLPPAEFKAAYYRQNDPGQMVGSQTRKPL